MIDKPIVLMVTIYPPKKNKRMVVVSGAPEGEMPLLLTGLFQDRHALLDQAYGAVLKRDPQLVTIKEEPNEDEKQGDQLVEEAPIPNPSPVSAGAATGEGSEELPAIEGDDVAKFEAQLSDISSTAEEDPADRVDRMLDTLPEEVDDGEQD